MNIPQYVTIEVTTAANFAFLSNTVLKHWHKKADELDAYCCANRKIIDKKVANLVLNSYLTIQQLGRCLDDICDGKMANCRVYCSADSQYSEIQAIVIQGIVNDKFYILFAVTNPGNLNIPPKQEKLMTGAVSVLIHSLLQNKQSYSELHIEAKDSAKPLAERIGFEASQEKASSSYLTPMKISFEKIETLAKTIPLNFQLEKEDILAWRFSVYNK